MEGEGRALESPGRWAGSQSRGRMDRVDAVCARMINCDNPRGIKLIDLAAKKAWFISISIIFSESPMKVMEDFVHPSDLYGKHPGEEIFLAADAEKYLVWWLNLGG